MRCCSAWGDDRSGCNARDCGGAAPSSVFIPASSQGGRGDMTIDRAFGGLRGGRALVLAGMVALHAASARAQSAVASVGTTAALSTVSQRHLVRLASPGPAPAWLLAVETDHVAMPGGGAPGLAFWRSDDEGKDRKSTRLNSSHMSISYAVFCLKKKIK